MAHRFLRVSLSSAPARFEFEKSISPHMLVKKMGLRCPRVYRARESTISEGPRVSSLEPSLTGRFEQGETHYRVKKTSAKKKKRHKRRASEAVTLQERGLVNGWLNRIMRN